MPTIVLSATWDVDTESPTISFNMTRSTTTVHDGAGAVRLFVTAGVAYWIKDLPGGPYNAVVASAWMRFNDLPDIDVPHIFGVFSAGVATFGLGYDVTSGQMFCEANEAGTPGGPVIVQDEWYALNLRFDGSAATHTVDAKVNGENLPQNTFPSGPSSVLDFRLGEYAYGPTMDLFFDTLQVSSVAADYPLLGTQPSLAWLGSA